ncbi:hypothetical protein M0R45_030785 [Rubus argutus]|uniref:Uncharacterized protein n=1 Tax=Rubus argutus TaxID=59490 RepID=A0AAW1WEP1_RUBAR
MTATDEHGLGGVVVAVDRNPSWARCAMVIPWAEEAAGLWWFVIDLVDLGFHSEVHLQKSLINTQNPTSPYPQPNPNLQTEPYPIQIPNNPKSKPTREAQPSRAPNQPAAINFQHKTTQPVASCIHQSPPSRRVPLIRARARSALTTVYTDRAAKLGF